MREHQGELDGKMLDGTPRRPTYFGAPPGKFRACDPAWHESDSGCWEWMRGLTAKGYGRLHVDGVAWRAHRRMYELAHGPIPPGLVVMHVCDNRSCINPDHLRAGTQMENHHDSLAKGRARYNAARGERAAKAKLTEDQVREIRMRHAAGDRVCDLAREMKVSAQAIIKIYRREAWKHVV